MELCYPSSNSTSTAFTHVTWVTFCVFPFSHLWYEDMSSIYLRELWGFNKWIWRKCSEQRISHNNMYKILADVYLLGFFSLVLFTTQLPKFILHQVTFIIVCNLFLLKLCLPLPLHPEYTLVPGDSS